MKCSSSMELDIHSTSGCRSEIRSLMFNTCCSADISLVLLQHREHNVHVIKIQTCVSLFILPSIHHSVCLSNKPIIHSLSDQPTIDSPNQTTICPAIYLFVQTNKQTTIHLTNQLSLSLNNYPLTCLTNQPLT